ncbi:hypothetical protein [Ruegeria pomeroyi]|nr:hypothetical protein [Ruegeria pomeroyi]
MFFSFVRISLNCLPLRIGAEGIAGAAPAALAIATTGRAQENPR